jgi:hypothetical protein
MGIGFFVSTNGNKPLQKGTKTTPRSPKQNQPLNFLYLVSKTTFLEHLITPSNLKTIISTNCKVKALKLIKLG